MGLASLGGVHLRIDPDQVRWGYRLKVARRRTVGGVVVQVYGVELGDMVVTGVFGAGDRGRGDEAGWEDMERFRAQVERWLDAGIRSSGAEPLRFVYPPRRWDFRVLIRDYRAADGGDAVRHSLTNFNPTWALTLFVVEDSTGRVVQRIKDSYIARLMAGVGWKQSQYNGPLSQADVDGVLAPFGGDLKSYLADQFNQAAGTTGNIASGASQQSSGAAAGGTTVDAWITEAGQVMGRTFTASERAGLKIIAQHESTNSATAVNNLPGTTEDPTGLMQMKPGTFAAHALPGHNDIRNPVDNIIASVRYIESRPEYGSIDGVPGVRNVRAGRPYGAGY